MRTIDNNNKASITHGTYEESIINIQLSYNSEAPTEPDLWSSSFHPISLHKLIEYFASDSKNIKDSLNFMAKYIFNKQVNSSKANELNDFDGMDNAIWNFISLVYKAKWDSLIINNKYTTLRTKISSKFIPRVVPNINKNNKEITKLVLISIEKASPLPPLPAKSKNEVNSILKYFQGSNVVATTHWNGTHSMLTSAKLTEGYLVVGFIRELNKEPLLYCSSIYTIILWSMLQQY